MQKAVNQGVVTPSTTDRGPLSGQFSVPSILFILLFFVNKQPLVG